MKVVKTIYLSGPMSGLPDFNRKAFNAAAEALRRSGKKVINPAELNETPVDCSWEGCMRVCLRALPDADVLALLPGWETSRGAHLELHIAHRIGIEVMSIADLFAQDIGRLPVELER